MKNYIALILFAIVVSGCEKPPDVLEGLTSDITGSWINPRSGEVTTIFERSEGLQVGDYGITFHVDNTITERKNAGWCGTPPISYADYEGNWALSDSILNMEVGYWGGKVESEWLIVEVNENSLVINILGADYIQESDP